MLQKPDEHSWVPIGGASVLISKVLQCVVTPQIPMPENTVHGAVTDQRVVVEVQPPLDQPGQSFHILPWQTAQTVGREVQHAQERVTMVLDGEEREVCELVEAEVGLFQAAQAAQCASLHLCDLVIEKKELLQPPQPLEVVLLHHMQLVGGQVKVPEAGGVAEHPMAQGAQLVVGHPEVFQSRHPFETARTQPGQMVVADVKGDGEGGQGQG